LIGKVKTLTHRNLLYRDNSPKFGLET
jgi:hypothetical protein